MVASLDHGTAVLKPRPGGLQRYLRADVNKFDLSIVTVVLCFRLGQQIFAQKRAQAHPCVALRRPPDGTRFLSKNLPP